jgi:hypothetical protein
MTPRDCPACGYGFMRRQAGGCPRCGARLVIPPEYLAPGDHPCYVWNGQEWEYRPAPWSASWVIETRAGE